jgi:DNA adenine methylase
LHICHGIFSELLCRKNWLKDNNNFLRPFIRWAGGKQNLVKYLLENTPNDQSINKYWEPFLGAGSLFFANGFTNAEISDVNEHLINSYQQIRDKPKSVYNRLLYYERNLSADFYYEVRDAFNRHLYENTIEQAARFIFLVHTSFNGIYRVNGNGEYNVPFGKENPSLPSFDHIEKISKKLKRVTVKAQPYENILSLVKKGDFIYLDPPYPKLDEKDQFQQFTIDKFSETHQKELAGFSEALKKKGCYVMISNSKVPLIENLYANWQIVEIPVIRYVSCKKERKKITELLIKNY